MQTTDTLKPTEVALLYQSHHAWLSGWLRSRVGCHEHAADLAQDTFVRLLRARQASPLKEPRLLPEAEVPSEEHRLVILDTLERLDRALHTLKPRTRQAFLLAQIDGLSITQIALQLDVARVTIERDLAKALGVCYRLRYVDL